ncbi:hypothetical protein [Nodosilinea nodulosa]|uniref:hypothetical protein n=1 Tax=Nodosilinea nodulosa TaxID=416001 RepID=UPI00037CC8B8|nr:hypothetical protein [Nodosilinea nodulosa]
MFTIELTLKHTAMPLSVQKKDQGEAEALYNSIAEGLRSSSAQLVEITCDQQPHKRISILGGEIAAVQIFEKSGTATASGRPPGFFALSSDQ